MEFLVVLRKGRRLCTSMLIDLIRDQRIRPQHAGAAPLILEICEKWNRLAL
jgi:hypothetical protein